MKRILQLCLCLVVCIVVTSVNASAETVYTGSYSTVTYNNNRNQFPYYASGYKPCPHCGVANSIKYLTYATPPSSMNTITLFTRGGRYFLPSDILTSANIGAAVTYMGTNIAEEYTWSSVCQSCRNRVTWNHCTGNSTPAPTNVQFIPITAGSTDTSGNVVFKSCSFPMTVRSSYKATVQSGSFTGNPGLVAPKFEIKKATITDTGSATSSYSIHEESEAEIATVNGQRVTTIKLSNPPIVIDWSGFEFDLDIAAPTIEVLRNPADSQAVVSSSTGVTLTINAYDSKSTAGEADPRISVNGGSYRTGLVTYKVTENQTVSIIAVDGNGNTREYQVTVSNIDTEKPTISGLTFANDKWTKEPVRATVTASDDVKLHATAYRFTFLSTADEKAGKTFSNPTYKGSWQADRSYLVPNSGTVWVEVRDSLGQIATSDPYYINNIDKIAPTATITLSPASGQASPDVGVTVTIDPVNTGDPKTEDASPLASSFIRWDSGGAWSDATSKTFYENGTYSVQVRDSVGNVSAAIPITISNIVTSKPVITSFTGDHTRADFVQAPVTLKVTAAKGSDGGADLHERPYSWDGGDSWTSTNTHTVTRNGEYSVLVRDKLGTTVEGYTTVSNIDSVVPGVGVYLYKGAPDDWDDVDPPTIDDYVWKVRVEASDLGSGVDHIETLWNGGTSTQPTIVQEIEEPGVYGVIVYDRAGNHTYAEKTVSAEAIGQAVGTANNETIPITTPSAGGTAGAAYGGADINDLVYSKTGAYNKSTGTFTDYATAGYEGIVVNLTATSKSNRFVTGYATFNSSRYPVEINGSASGSQGGKNMLVVAKIPKSAMTTDVKNGRLIVVLQEYDGDPGVNNVNGATLTKEGSVTLFTSVQANDPHINYTYNRATDELTLVATSAVAGIKSKTYSLGGSTTEYTAPFTVGGATSIVLTAVDNCGNITSLTLDGTQLSVSGEGGGSLPTEAIADSGELPVYYTAGRNSETYIIGGTRTNTENIPAQGVLESILDGAA